MSSATRTPPTTSVAEDANRAANSEVPRQVASPFPPEITEHPGWKAIWRKLLTPRTDTPGEERQS